MRNALAIALIVAAFSVTVLTSYLLAAHAMAYLHGGELRGVAAMIMRQ